jgi:Tol biopolymer transport system component
VISLIGALAMTVVACGGAAEDEGQAAPEGPTATATPVEAGEVIVFERSVAGAEERDLYAVGLDGVEAALLRSASGSPHWAPDGSQLAFLACLNPPECTTEVALLERSTGEVSWFPMPDPDLFTACVVWAPSGAELACEGQSEADPTRNGAYSVPAADGQGLAQITTNPDGFDAPLAYSPDGTQLLLSREDPLRNASALFITPIGGGEPHRVTPWGYADDWAGWSPDGRTIVFGTDGRLYQVSPEGQGLAQIPLSLPDGTPVRSAFDVSFSPDGDTIVFSVGSPAPGIYRAQLDGSDVQRLTSGQDHHASWGPSARGS